MFEDDKKRYQRELEAYKKKKQEEKSEKSADAD